MDLRVDVLGVNRIDQAAFNDAVINERRLVWIQDNEMARLWDSWEVTYRDVMIVDASNELIAVYNLTMNSLEIPAHRATLLQMLRASATLTDADADGLQDEWEMTYFGDLTTYIGNDDPDHDGADNRSEYAFGSHPLDPRSVPRVTSMIWRAENNAAHPALTFRRRAGSAYRFRVELSRDLRAWVEDAGQIELVGGPVIPFDGSGTVFVTYAAKATRGELPRVFFRAGEMIEFPSP